MLKLAVKKVMAMFLTALMVVAMYSLFPIENMEVSAICCRKDGFDKSRYTLTGNMAQDVATIAKSQKGRWCNDFGYSGVDYGAWCDEFVADCIENAGADSSIVGHGGTVADFERVMRNKGAVPVSSPQTGDLIFFTKSHVEIVTKVENGVVYCAGGNNGDPNNGGKYKSPGCCAGERKASTVGTTRLFLRPNYKGRPTPTLVTPTISTDKGTYTVGDTVNISWTASPSNSNLSHYWLVIIDPDGSYVYADGMGKNTSYSFIVSKQGNYSITTYATPKGSLEGEGSLTDSVNISVSKAVWYDGISPVDVGSGFYAYIINVNSWHHLTNDNGNVATYTETGAANQIWKFDRRADGSYKITNCADGNVLDVVNFGSTNGTNVAICGSNDDSAQRWFIYGASGEFIFRADCTDCVLDISGGSSDDGANVQIWEKNETSAQLFQIWKLMPELSVEPGNQAKHTVFSWENFPGNDRIYDLKIWKGTLWEEDPYYIEWGLNGTSYEIGLPAGHYEAYVDTRIGNQILMNNVVKFDITEDYFGQSELKVVTGDKYNETHFEWTPVEKAEFYDLKIWNGTVWEGDAFTIEWDIKDTSIDLALPAGYYEAYIDARDSNHIQMSNVVKFSVTEAKTIKGDTNNDTKITITDIIVLQKYLLNQGKLTAPENADLNDDGRINIFDLCLLKNMLISS